MTKRKPVDELRWAWARADGSVTVARKHHRREDAYNFRDPGETVIRVRVTEVPKKRKGKR